MGSTSWIAAITGDFISPTATKLRTTITALEVTSVIKIDFHITWHNIFFSCGILYGFKIYCGPRLPGSVVAVTEFALIFHVPTIGTFCRSFLL
jgi:hypothetical protein